MSVIDKLPSGLCFNDVGSDGVGENTCYLCFYTWKYHNLPGNIVTGVNLISTEKNRIFFVSPLHLQTDLLKRRYTVTLNFLLLMACDVFPL